MKNIFFSLVFISLIIAGCDSKKVVQSKTESKVIDLPEVKLDTLVEQTFLVDEEYANYYIVVADSSSDFNALNKDAELLSKLLKVEYIRNKKLDSKDGLVYSDDVQDDIYIYYHRRYQGTEVSIERVAPYFNSISGDNVFSMLVLVGIYEKEEEAKKLLNIISPKFSKAFIQKTELYMGCIH